MTVSLFTYDTQIGYYLSLIHIFIKVERVEDGDQSREWGPYADNGNSGYFALYNRNKESIAIDLSHSEGKACLLYTSRCV